MTSLTCGKEWQLEESSAAERGDDRWRTRQRGPRIGKTSDSRLLGLLRREPSPITIRRVVVVRQASAGSNGGGTIVDDDDDDGDEERRTHVTVFPNKRAPGPSLSVLPSWSCRGCHPRRLRTPSLVRQISPPPRSPHSSGPSSSSPISSPASS